jgi:hypothetical protein
MSANSIWVRKSFIIYKHLFNISIHPILERFLRKCARYDFLINSEEFRIFARPATGDIEKMLDRLPKIPSGTMIERTREVTNINEKLFDFADKERFNNVVIEFGFFAKKVLLQMKTLKK